MAFLKYANAAVMKPAISMAGWDSVRERALRQGAAFEGRTASKVVFRNYHPDKYLLSHCTIIASVDTESANLPLGRQVVDGFQIDRRFNDYLVTAKTTQYINNNHDCWERKLLLSCFHTFVGGENYVEHLQIPELSKGKIVDAAARDIGDSIYVDILVATNLQHMPLVRAIKSKQLQTLSMGCQVAFTTCTKCGNVAADETQLCSHIRYLKGQSYLDGIGRTRRIAELCGHITEEPGSVKFIEASWVANPAFTGAVLRNILSPEEQALVMDRVHVAMSMPTRRAEPNAMVRAAKLLNQDPKKASFGNLGFGQQDQSGLDGQQSQDPAPAPKPPADPFDGAVSDLADLIREKALAKVRGEIDKDDVLRADLAEDRNDTLLKEALQKSPAWKGIARVVLGAVGNPNLSRRVMHGLVRHKAGGWRAVSEGKFSGSEMLAISRFVDRFNETPRIAGEERIYRTVLTVGGVSPYADVGSYLAACRRVVGRELTGSEADALVAKGRIYDLGAS